MPPPCSRCRLGLLWLRSTADLLCSATLLLASASAAAAAPASAVAAAAAPAAAAAAKPRHCPHRAADGPLAAERPASAGEIRLIGAGKFLDNSASLSSERGAGGARSGCAAQLCQPVCWELPAGPTPLPVPFQHGTSLRCPLQACPTCWATLQPTLSSRFMWCCENCRRPSQQVRQHEQGVCCGARRGSDAQGCLRVHAQDGWLLQQCPVLATVSRPASLGSCHCSTQAAAGGQQGVLRHLLSVSADCDDVAGAAAQHARRPTPPWAQVEVGPRTSQLGSLLLSSPLVAMFVCFCRFCVFGPAGAACPLTSGAGCTIPRPLRLLPSALYPCCSRFSSERLPKLALFV